MYRKGVLALTVGLAACNSASQPVPLDVAIRTIEIDLQKAAVIPLSDIGASDTGRLNTVADSIFSYQCFYKMPNPVIAVLTTQFSLGLQGTFSQGGKVSVGGIGTAPTAGLEYDVSNGQQQTLTLPMAFVTVADLPALYLSQGLGYISGVPDAQKKPLVTDLLKKQHALEARIQPLIQSFPSRESACRTRPDGSPELPHGVIQPRLL